jgi:hypothetical protein
MCVISLKGAPDAKVRQISYGKSLAEVAKHLKENEIAVALANNGRWELAPHLFDEDEFKEFHTQYCNGHMISWIMYAVDKDYFEMHRN